MYKALIKFKERSRDKKNYNTKINNIQYCKSATNILDLPTQLHS